jgi:GT2 family glycosyltransferase
MYRGYLYTDDPEAHRTLGPDSRKAGAMQMHIQPLSTLEMHGFPRNATCVMVYGEGAPAREKFRPFEQKKFRVMESLPTWNDIAKTTELVGLAQLRDPHFFAPRVSIIVTTHRQDKFYEGPFQRSIKRQTFKDFEIVVVHDGEEPGPLKGVDTQVGMPEVNRIGYLKGMAVAAARAEIVVELDHDDELMPDALEWIVEVFNGKPDVGFVYSKFAEVKADGTCNEYQSPLWNYRSWLKDFRWFRVADLHDIEGRYVVNGVDNPTIMHMGLCPNHVRAWRRSEYFKIGGYRDLPWCDDYDLMLRFRLRSSMRMHGIDQLLYVQYIGNSTWVKDPAMLTRGMIAVQETYADELKEKLGATMI